MVYFIPTFIQEEEAEAHKQPVAGVTLREFLVYSHIWNLDEAERQGLKRHFLCQISREEFLKNTSIKEGRYSHTDEWINIYEKDQPFIAASVAKCRVFYNKCSYVSLAQSAVGKDPKNIFYPMSVRIHPARKIYVALIRPCIPEKAINNTYATPEGVILRDGEIV